MTQWIAPWLVVFLLLGWALNVYAQDAPRWVLESRQAIERLEGMTVLVLRDTPTDTCYGVLLLTNQTVALGQVPCRDAALTRAAELATRRKEDIKAAAIIRRINRQLKTQPMAVRIVP